MQVDNDLPLTPAPVLLAPELHEDEDYVIKAIACMKTETNQAVQVYPYLGFQVRCFVRCHDHIDHMPSVSIIVETVMLSSLR